jgi:hypothetical protein
VAECEGIFQKLNDFGLGFHVVQAFVVAAGEVQFLRRKIELVLRHRLGRFDDFLLNKTNLAIDR